jgi:hypothetical protein
MRAGNLPTRIEAAHGHLLGKRRLLIVVLVLAIDALVCQLVGFAFHSLFFIGNRVDAVVRSCGLRTLRNIGIRFIRHGFTLQANSMRSMCIADARHKLHS